MTKYDVYVMCERINPGKTYSVPSNPYDGNAEAVEIGLFNFDGLIELAKKYNATLSQGEQWLYSLNQPTDPKTGDKLYYTIHVDPEDRDILDDVAEYFKQ